MQADGLHVKLLFQKRDDAPSNRHAPVSVGDLIGTRPSLIPKRARSDRSERRAPRPNRRHDRHRCGGAREAQPHGVRNSIGEERRRAGSAKPHRRPRCRVEGITNGTQEDLRIVVVKEVPAADELLEAEPLDLPGERPPVSNGQNGVPISPENGDRG